MYSLWQQTNLQRDPTSLDILYFARRLEKVAQLLKLSKKKTAKNLEILMMHN